MMSRRRRTILIMLAVICGTPAALVAAFFLWRTSPPQGAPRIGLSVASSFAVQRPLYEEALARAGGRAVPITPTDDAARLSTMLDGIDALLLTGGNDVDPALYADQPDNAAGTAHRRDEFEIRLIHAALERNMPILGICRGIQILNVAHGGSLRNLRADEALADHHGIRPDSFSAHDVEVAEGTRLAEAIGPGVRRVNSFHGQAVGRVGAGLRPCAVADDDVIEGIERTDRPFVIGIQWHPEIASLTDDTALTLFRALIRHAAAYRDSRPVNSAATP